ncbi:MAG: hypothetical protein AAF725_13335 [Acidobacteriota bacterium]
MTKRKPSAAVDALRHPLPALAACGLVALLFPTPGQDDFFITLWPATTLAWDGEIVNYSGERIEQSSALLLTLLLAAWSFVTGQAPDTAARALSAMSALAALALLAPLSGARREIAEPAAWLLALSAPFLYWAASGTETPLMALLLLAWLAAVRRLVLRPGVAALAAVFGASLLVAMNRPEGSLLLLAALSWPALLSLREGSRRRRVWWLALGAVAASFLTLRLARMAYFGSPWPLPVEAKAGALGSTWSSRLADGAGYLAAWNGFGAFGLPLLVAVGAGGLLIARRSLDPEAGADRDPGELLAALLAAASLGFAVTSGGDWMEGGRFLAPGAPFFALVGGGAARRNREPGRRALALAILLLSSAASIVALAAHPKTRALPLWRCPQLAEPGSASPRASARPFAERCNKAQLRDLEVVEFLDDLVARARQAGLAPLTFASHQMGFVSYRLSRRHAGSLRVIDAAGLVERSLIDCGAIADQLTRNAGGLWRRGYDYDPLLKVRFLLEHVRSCRGPGRIDVLYELGIPDPELLAEHGLRTIYVQDGTFLRRPSFTFVAVRSEWIEALGIESLQRVEYASRDGRTHITRSSRPLSAAPTGSPGARPARASWLAG